MQNVINEMADSLFAKSCIEKAQSETVVRPSISYFQDAWRRLRKNKVAMASMVFLGLMVVLCIAIPVVFPISRKHRIWLIQIRDQVCNTGLVRTN